jgi:hypothetical protein
MSRTLTFMSKFVLPNHLVGRRCDWCPIFTFPVIIIVVVVLFVYVITYYVFRILHLIYIFIVVIVIEDREKVSS